MATKTPRVAVTFTVDSTGYSAAVAKNKAQLIDFGEASKKVSHGMVTDVQATSGALRTLEGGVSNNIRAAERWLASIKGVGPALQAIYPAVGMIAVVGVIAKGVSELTEFIKKQRDAAAEFKRSFQEIQNASRLSNDELAKTNVELENQISKLTGKHENVLAAQLADARIEADKLADSAAKAAKEIKDLLDKNKVGLLGQILQKGATGYVYGNIENFQNLKAGSQQDYSDAMHRGDKAAADKAKEQYAQYLKNERAWLLTNIQGTKSINGGAGGDQSNNLQALQAALNLNYDQSDRVDLDAQNQKLSGTLKTLQDGKNLAQKQMEAFRQQYAEFVASLTAGPEETEQQFHARQLAAEADFWARKLSILRKGTDNYKAVQKELNDIIKQSNQLYAQAQTEALRLQQEQQKFISGSFGDNLDLSRSGNLDGANQGKDVLAMVAAMHESVAVANETADAWKEAQISIGLAAGTLSKYDAAMQTMQLHKQQYERATTRMNSERDYLTRLYAGQENTPEARAAFEQLANQQGQLNGQFRVQSAQDQQSIASETPLGAWKQALDQFVQQSKDTASQVRDIWSGALSSVNEEIVKIISTRHNYGVRQEFGNLGAGMFRNVAGAALQKGEGALLGAFGFGNGKPDGTESKPLHVIIAGSKHAIAGAGAGVTGMVKDTVSDAGNWIGKVGGFASKLFSGLGFADGGMPPVGVASLVGENGPELFVPKVSGTVVPNSQLGGRGGDVHFHPGAIDARGATDPAAVEAAAHRAVMKAMPQIAAATTHAQQSGRMRMPSSRRA